MQRGAKGQLSLAIALAPSPLGAQLSHRDEEPNQWPCHVLQMGLLHKHYLPLPPAALCWNGRLSMAGSC